MIAYLIWEQEGGKVLHDVQCWLQAEKGLLF